ncbi:hypothetical protein NPX13_g6788 [Xylaria arbuscula]|uniref:Protection of telomeres protein 1 n=1 Tax=Xylaria arbuscula TaxID=114810 RepID=A0A9W8NBT2_9PEZI|nr:hypothetical protein NPX13_g6788 [Xylaria arbuscula]
MAPNQPSSSARFVSRNKELPSRYTSIVDILEEKIAGGRLVNVMGLVKDYQTPRSTNGTDYKCTITIYDKSLEYQQAGISISIFRQEEEMPRPTAGDVLVIHSAKVQSYRDTISLITHRSTSFHIYSAADIPEPPQSALCALQAPQNSRSLGEADHEYVSCLYHFTNRSSIPDEVTFQNKVDQSAHTKDKFCELNKISDGKFYDVIVNVVKAPFDDMGKTTLWVSDYTENDTFHKYSWDGQHTDIHTTTKWAGPFGRRSMQVTCFEPHASQVKTEVQLGQWIRIRNLRIKYGRNGLNLEGVLHEDREFKRNQIEILKLDGKDNCDPRLIKAIRRKKDYETLKKKQHKSFSENEIVGDAGGKRKAETEETPKLNFEAKAKAETRGSPAVKCERSEHPASSISSILETVLWKTTVEGEEVTLTLPFTCVTYRTNVRVVDFHPQKLENFAAWRRTTEFDVLSDGGSDSDSESDSDHGSPALKNEQKIWEWRFALQLEDADPKLKGEKEKFWAIVNNTEGQQLTGLDACDLRRDPDVLNSLREQLFRLWGNLEELKLQEQNRQFTNRRRLAANLPPPSSPMDIDHPHAQQKTGDVKNKGYSSVGLSNKPFSCCIQQAGVKLREPDPLLADAGEGRRWQRVYNIFGTKIQDLAPDSP